MTKGHYTRRVNSLKKNYPVNLQVMTAVARKAGIEHRLACSLSAPELLLNRHAWIAKSFKFKFSELLLAPTHYFRCLAKTKVL